MKGKYTIVLYPKALDDMDKIYRYIYNILRAPEYAMAQLERLENGMFGLEELPLRCAERKSGSYGNCGYRELLVDNYTVIYRVNEDQRQVQIVTVQYNKRNC